MIIVGYEKEQAEMAELNHLLKNAEKYRENGIRLPRGILLYGEPGVGKTIMARSIASKGISLIELRASDCYGDKSGDMISSVFQKAKQEKPAVLLLDELDKIAGTSNLFFMEDNDNTKKVLLQELDALSPDDNVLVVATCNSVSGIGNALLRSGRFDRQLLIDIPSEEDRVKILNYYYSKIKIKPDFSIDYLAKITAGYTCSKLECIVNESALAAMEANWSTIPLFCLLKVMNKLAFHGDERDIKIDQEEQKKIAVHEAGHAVLALILTPEKIFNASIIPQGDCAGHVRLMDIENRVKSIRDAENDIAVLLAGRTAEYEIYGDYFLGSSDDIKRASAVAISLAKNHAAYGFDVSASASKYEHNFMDDDNSQLFLKTIGAVLSRIENTNKKIISSNKNLLNAITNKLVEKHVLDHDELVDIYNSFANEISQ